MLAQAASRSSTSVRAIRSRLLVAGEGRVDGDDRAAVIGRRRSPSRCAAVTIAAEQQHRHALVRDRDVDLDARRAG